KGNSCFIDIDTLQPFSDQWDFLKNILRFSTAKLDELYEIHNVSQNISVSALPKSDNDKLTITLNNVVSVNRNAIPFSLINFLKEELNFLNSEFLIKKKMGKNTF